MENFRSNFWQQNPLLRVLIPFIAGILSVTNRSQYSAVLFISVVVCFSVYTLSVLLGYKYFKHKYRFIHGYALILFFFAAGYILTVLTNNSSRNNFFTNNFKKGNLLVVEIKNTKVSSTDKVRAEADVLYRIDSTILHETTGRLMINFITGPDFNSSDIKYGSRWLISCNPYKIKEPTNPGDFNYKKYMSCKGIYYQTKITPGNYIFIGKRNFSLRSFAIEIRDNLLKIFSESGLKGQELAVTSALVLGYVDDLDTEILREYSATGAMHILSVSGMHVGLIYLVLDFLISLLSKKEKFQKFKSIIIIISIWFYALLTGLSPSVFRAVAMLSFVTAGKTLKRNTSIYNTLCASAILILLTDTQLIKNIGFQLSYIAVLGIVILYKPICNMWHSRFKIIRKLWELTAVSLAAQIATGPLSLLYFAQFPNYFILTNIVATPLSSLVIYTAITTMFLAPVKFAGIICIKVLYFTVKSLNTSLGFIEHLPCSVTRNICISPFQCIIIYSLIISVLLIIHKKQKLYLGISGLLLLTFITVSLIRAINLQNRRQAIIFNYHSSSAMGFYSGKHAVIIADTTLINSNNKQPMLPSWAKVYPGIKNLITIPWQNCPVNVNNDNLRKTGPFITFTGKSFFILDNCWYAKNNNINVTYVDYLIIKKHKNMNKINDILKYLKPQTVILDPTIPVWCEKLWQEECPKHNIYLHITRKEGAFTINAKNQ